MNKKGFYFESKIFSDIQARSCNWQLLLDGEHETIEIVQWDKEDHCCTIAFFKVSEESFDLQFVGDRPFKLSGEKREAFWELAEFSHQVLFYKKNGYTLYSSNISNPLSKDKIYVQPS